MNTRQLRTFVTLADTCNIHKAAERLYLTPPGVKHVLDSLERDCGLKLFARGRAGLELTASGAVFADYARRVLELLDEGLMRAGDAEPLAAHTIFAPYIEGPKILSRTFLEALEAFRREHPEVSLAFKTVKSLVGERFDAVNGIIGDGGIRVSTHHLETLPLCCGVSRTHPLSVKRSVAIDELDPYELLVPPDSYVSLMDEHTRGYIAQRRTCDGSFKPKVTTSAARDHDGWCITCGGVALAIGQWARDDPAQSVVHVPIEGAGFSYNLYTPLEPNAITLMYVAFIEEFYRRRAEASGL